MFMKFRLHLIFIFFRELRAEVEKITALREELDKMKKLVEHSESKEKQDEIDRLKKQLIASEETLAKSQQ